MQEGEFDFDQASLASNPAAYVARLDDDALGALCRYAEGIIRHNDTAGGWPATVKWVCVFEGAKRFFSKTENTRQA